MTPVDERRVHGRGQKDNGGTPLEIAARNREKQTRQEREKKAELHADPAAEHRGWENLGWSNFSV